MYKGGYKTKIYFYTTKDLPPIRITDCATDTGLKM